MAAHPSRAWAMATVAWLAFAGVVSPSFAAETTSLVDRVEAKYASVQTMRATFVQTAESEMFGKEVQKGELWVKRPSKMRWSFANQRLFVTNGKKMWIFTQADNQVIEYDDIGSTRSTTDSLLQSLDKLDELFQVAELAGANGGHALELRPEDEGQFQKIVLHFDPNLVVTKVLITDAFDAVTELVFTDVALNPSADDALFEFAVPDGAEVVKASAP